MRHRHVMAVVAATATLLATMPLASVFDSWSWLFLGLLVTAAVVGAATLARMLHAPAGVQVLAMMLALLLVLTVRFPSGDEIAGFIPTGETFRHFNELLALAGQQIRDSAVPVPDLEGLLLLSTAGIGLVAVLVDLAAVGIGRPALAGLPMLALYSVPVAVLPDGVSFLSFAVACAGYLWLLVSDSVDRVRRFGRRFSGDGHDVDIWAPSPLAAAGRRLGIVAIAAAIVLPLAVPAMTPSLLGKFGPGPGPGGPGAPGIGPIAAVDLNALLYDNLTLDETILYAIVTTDDPDPYYLRIAVLEDLDADGFHGQLPGGGGYVVDQPLPSRVPPGASVVGTYRAEIEVRGLSLSFAPAYPLVTAINGLRGTWLLHQDTEQVYSRDANVLGQSYSVNYAKLGYSANDLRNALPLSFAPAGLNDLTAHPENTYVANQVAQITEGLTNQYDTVRALYDYFHEDNGFRYTLTPPPGTSGSAIQDFLTIKQGFCQQYAAALAWMVREAGYPARVAVGFTRGSGRNGTYELTNRNLHAWTEVYFPNYGWVPFDATPSRNIAGAARTDWAPENATGSSGPIAQPSEGGPTAAPSVPLPEETEGPGVTAPGEGNPWQAISAWHVAVAVAVVLAIILLVTPGLQRRARRRRRLASVGTVIALSPAPEGTEDLVTDPDAIAAAQKQAHAAWTELLDTMIDYGVLVDPTETPRATADRLATTAELAPTGHAPTAVLARAEERARYAPTPVRAADLRASIKAAREAFDDNATLRQRISARLFPRSVLMRWRLGWFGFVANTARRVSRVRDAILLVPLRERRHARRR